ncbi:MAG: metallophosphoesterase [bacterium]
MKLGLISDTHGSKKHTRYAAQHFKDEPVNTIVHCGDVTLLTHLLPLKDINVPLHVVFGNMDRGQQDFLDADERGAFQHHGQSGTFVLDGKTVAMTHGHRQSKLNELIHSEADYVIHGHTHERRDETIDGTRVINPGAIKPPNSSAAILDLSEDELRFIDI